MKVRFEISDGINPVRIVDPQIGTDGSVKWEKMEAPIYDFKKELKEVTLIKDDYKYFLDRERSGDRCNKYFLDVIVGCGGGEETVIFSGTFSMASGKWDLDRCVVRFKIEAVDYYACVDEAEDEINIFSYGGPNVGVGLSIVHSFETFYCNNNCPPDSVMLNQKWVLWYIWPPSKQYLREIYIVPCDFIPPNDWIEVSACIDGQKTFAKKYNYIPVEQSYPSGGTSYFSLDTKTDPVSNLVNGRKLENVMSGILNSLCPEHTIKSEFFQWNPDIATQINYVTDELNIYSNLILFQKSDVKRPDASNQATKGMVVFKTLLKQICEIFNCRYIMTEDELRIEHLSWFESDFGMSLITEKNKNLLKGTRKYEYDQSKLPKFETFKFMEDGSADFVGVPIEYLNECTNTRVESKREVNIDLITTDVMLCLENPDPESQVSDKGFVLVACDDDNNIIYEAGILDNSTTINNVLSWAHLHEKLFKYGRVFKNGNMNNIPTDFLSTIPTIKQDQFSAKMDCAEIKVFDPKDKIEGALGWGAIQSATFKLSKCTFDLDLYLQDFQEVPMDEMRDGDFDHDFDYDFD